MCKSQIRMRDIIERAFGIWKRRFSCLDMRAEGEVSRGLMSGLIQIQDWSIKVPK